MHAAKLVLLLVLTLAVMRAASWSLGWLLKRFSTMKRLWISALSNGVALAAFGCLLATQSVPGELIDTPALTFGVVVFSVFALIDFRWTRWARTESGNNAAS